MEMAVRKADERTEGTGDELKSRTRGAGLEDGSRKRERKVDQARAYSSGKLTFAPSIYSSQIKRLRMTIRALWALAHTDD